MATLAQQVRLLAGLTADELPDGDIDTFLDLNDDTVKLAAADALEAYAGTLATVTVTSDDISLDGSKRATLLMQRAARLREQHTAATAADTFAFDVVDSPAHRPELTEHGWA